MSSAPMAGSQIEISSSTGAAERRAESHPDWPFKVERLPSPLARRLHLPLLLGEPGQGHLVNQDMAFAAHPLARALLEVAGVASLFVAGTKVTVTTTDKETDWEALLHGLARATRGWLEQARAEALPELTAMTRLLSDEEDQVVVGEPQGLGEEALVNLAMAYMELRLQRIDLLLQPELARARIGQYLECDAEEAAEYLRTLLFVRYIEEAEQQEGIELPDMSERAGLVSHVACT